MDATAAIAIADRLGRHLESWQPLTGGVSAEVVALQLSGTTVVVRHHAPGPDWKQGDAVQRARVEYGVMRGLAEAGLPVPRPDQFDGSGAILPGPWFLLPYVENTAPPVEAVERAAMADALRALHALAVTALPEAVWTALPRRTDPFAELDALLSEDHEALDTPVLRAVRARVGGERLPDVGGGARLDDLAILHGDFWSGNLLWGDNGELRAILDWEDAAVGDPLADLAGALVEMAWRSGEPAAESLYRACAVGRDPIDPVRWAAWVVYIAAAGCAWMGHWGLPEAQVVHQRAVSTRLIERFGRRLVG